jgi:hypothetical protein
VRRAEAANDVLYQFKLMPLLVLAAQVCPASIEGTLFAFIMQMSNTGGTYSGYFGSWFSDHLQISAHDFTGLELGNLLRIFFRLAPILMIWMVPMSNPKDVIAQIDAELKAGSEGEGGGEVKPSDGDGPQKHSERSVLMPFVLMSICLGAPAMKMFGMPVTYLAAPVVALIVIPTYETFLRPMLTGRASASVRLPRRPSECSAPSRWLRMDRCADCRVVQPSMGETLMQNMGHMSDGAPPSTNGSAHPKSQEPPPVAVATEL